MKERIVPPTRESLRHKIVHWPPGLVRDLRGKRSQFEFAELVGVAKNTVWRWEAGHAAPDAAAAARLNEIAEREDFFADWQLVGSITRIGDLEEGSRQIVAMIKKSIARTTRELH
jgi:transcriptional regulator with XRE-family HTH domain